MFDNLILTPKALEKALEIAQKDPAQQKSYGGQALTDWTPEAVAARVRYRHPRFTEEQVQAETRYILAAKADREEAAAKEPLDAGDTESRLQESADAHAKNANAQRSFTHRAMLK